MNIDFYPPSKQLSSRDEPMLVFAGRNENHWRLQNGKIEIETFKNTTKRQENKDRKLAIKNGDFKNKNSNSRGSQRLTEEQLNRGDGFANWN